MSAWGRQHLFHRDFNSLDAKMLSILSSDYLSRHLSNLQHSLAGASLLRLVEGTLGLLPGRHEFVQIVVAVVQLIVLLVEFIKEIVKLILKIVEFVLAFLSKDAAVIFLGLYYF